MSETAESRVGKWVKLRGIIKRWEYWIGGTGLVLTVGVIVAVILYFDDIQALGGYGYLGAFLSVFLAVPLISLPCQCYR